MKNISTEPTPKKNSSILSYILYEGEGAPVFRQISKQRLSSYFIIAGLSCFFALLLSAGLITYFKEIHTLVAQKEPKIIRELREKSKELQTQLDESQQLATQLQQRLSKGTSSAHSQGANATVLDPFLFRSPLNQKNLSLQSILTIESPRAYIKGDKLHFDFRLMNNTEGGKRLSGFIFVLLNSKGHLFFFPKKVIENDFLIPFDRGEAFSTSRFRPFQSSFALEHINQKDQNLLFQVIVFNRLGDLLLRQIVPLNLNESS